MSRGFRIWDKVNKKYIDFSFATFLPYGELVGITTKNGRAPVLAENYTVEQSTGLKDENGKEIYEWDRIKIEGSDTIYTVEYGRGVWVARFGDEPGDNICLFHYAQKDTVLYAEVIGNIHEPPKDFRPEHLKRMGVSISKGGEE